MFTSAAGKLRIRVLWQHDKFLIVITQIDCRVFIKSYNFVFMKINNEYAPHQKSQKSRRFCRGHMHRISFRH